MTSFVRSMFVDPAVEAEAKELLKELRGELREASATMKQARKAIKRHGNVQSLVALSGAGLVAAGLMLGFNLGRLTPEELEKLSEDVRRLRKQVSERRK